MKETERRFYLSIIHENLSSKGMAMISNRFILQLSVVAGIIACCTLSSATPPLKGQIYPRVITKTVNWEKNLNTAHQKAIKTNKPILILFGASWCRYCKKLEKETVNHPKMASYINKTFIPVHLDLDQDKRIAKILGVKKLPCTVILSPEADLLGKYVGYEKPVTYFDKIAKARKKQEVIRQVKYTTPAN